MSDEQHFSIEFWQDCQQEIEQTVRQHLRLWGASGFRIVGTDPHMRIEIVVPRTIQRPREPVSALVIAGRTIKPTVCSSGLHLRGEQRLSGNGTAIGLSHAIAPGARIRVGRGRLQNIVGVTCVLKGDNGTISLLTCGHAPAFDTSDEVLAGDDPNGKAIAKLQRNFLEESNPLDAALCPLTSDGVDVLKRSLAAPTWRFRSVHTPAAADNGRRTVLWQTHDGDDDAETATIESFSGETSRLFGARGPQRGFIESGHLVDNGDSGAPLVLGDSFYGLCSGFVGFTAFFTPIAAVITRLRNEGNACQIYAPS